MSPGTILIMGATGTIGRDTVRMLTGMGVPVRAMTRDPERARALPGFAGAEVVFGDGARPETLAAACAGIEKMMFVLPTEENWGALQRNIIAAARSSGVRHVVHVSAMGVSPDEPSDSLSLHYEGERLLEQSGMAFTHLRGNAFMQNVLNFYSWTIKASGVFYQCTGNAPMAHIDTRDIAEIAVLALTRDGHGDKAYDLTGPEVLRYSDVAEQLSAELGRTIRHVDLSAAEYEQATIAAGASAWLATEIVNIYNRGYYGTGKAGHVTDTARTLLGREPRSFRQFARDHAALLAP
jgi:uncharacterized protein YbjT (DUF2867 family)